MMELYRYVKLNVKDVFNLREKRRVGLNISLSDHLEDQEDSEYASDLLKGNFKSSERQEQQNRTHKKEK